MHLWKYGKPLEANVRISKVPREVFDADTQWDEVAAGRWRRAEHITLGEARSSLQLLERLASQPSARGFWVACLEDNEPWSSATAKGRSPVFIMNSLLRRLAALQLVADVAMELPWVDTKNQPADWLSRRACSGGRS